MADHGLANALREIDVDLTVALIERRNVRAIAISLVLIFLIWIKDNIPGRVDFEWLRRGGGIVGNDHPPAPRFNAGQKMIYWIVVLAGAAVAISGYLMMFPFYGTGMEGMQTATLVHGVVGVLMIAVMLAHIYIGTLGMEGAFEAMGTGEVDLNWAKEHHSLWVEEEMSRGAAGARATPGPLKRPASRGAGRSPFVAPKVTPIAFNRAGA